MPSVTECSFDYDVRETVLPAWARGRTRSAVPQMDDDGATGAAELSLIHI